MGLLQRLGLGAIEKRFSMLDYTGYAAGVPAYSVRDFPTLAKEGYSENAIAYACIDALATACASVPLKVERPTKTDKAEWEPYPSHALLEILKNPNAAQSGSEFIEALCSYYLIGGNVFLVLIGGPLDTTKRLTGKPRTLVIPRPDMVRPIPDAFGIPASFVIGVDRASTPYDGSRVIHLKTFNPLDPIFGLAPLAVAGRDVDVLNATTNYLYRLMRRSGRPDGVIISEAALKPEQYDRLQKQVDEKFNNADKPGGWKLFEGVVKEIKEFAFKPADMGLSQAQIDRIRNICAIYKVPPEILGVSEAKTYNNYAEARTALYVEGVLPLMDKIMSKLNQRLMPFYSETDRLAYDREKIEPLQEDRDKKATRNREDFRAGLYSANEMRAKNGDKPATDPLADQRMLGMGLTPADEYESADATTAQADGAAEQDDDLADTTEEDAKTGKENKRRLSEAAIELGLAIRTEALAMIRGVDPGMAWRAFDGTRVGYLFAARKIFAKELTADGEAVAEAIIKSGAVTLNTAERVVSDAIEGRRGAWGKALKKVYGTVGLGFAASVDKGLQGAFGEQKKKARAKRAAATTWESWISSYLAKVGGAKIQEISKTTRKRIMRTIEESYAAGNGADATAAAIQGMISRDISGRALRIARTEVVGASNAGSDAAARSFGVPLVKDWFVTNDGRQREAHEIAGASQVNIPLDAPFEVDGENMMFPGDASMGAEAGQIINCRCAVGYAVAEGDSAQASTLLN